MSEGRNKSISGNFILLHFTLHLEFLQCAALSSYLGLSLISFHYYDLRVYLMFVVLSLTVAEQFYLVVGLCAFPQPSHEINWLFQNKLKV